MGLRSPRTWKRFSQVNVDLGAVIGQGRVSERSPRGRDRSGPRAFDKTRWRTPLDAHAHRRLALPGGAHHDIEGGLLEAILPDDVMVESVEAVSGDTREVAEFSSLGGTHVVIQRQLEGMDVYGATVKLHFEKSGTSVTGDPDADLAGHLPSRRIRLRPEQATEVAGREMPRGARPAHVPQMVILPTPDGGHWAYVVTLVSERPIADVRSVIDASDGSVLLSFNRAVSAVGQAEVFPVNPARGAGPGRQPVPERVQLPGLADSPAGDLAGPLIAVDTGRPPAFRNPTLDFVCHPTNPAFDEPACYFYLSRGLAYFGGFYDVGAFGAPPFAPIRAIVNDPRSPRNARFVPDQGLLRFGAGARSWGRSGDIVVHELAHAVTHALSRLADAPGGSQCRGLSEGYSDYFASSLFDDPRFGDYVVPGFERNCSNQALRFPRGFRGDEHDTGAVWAAILWDLRSRLGTDMADRIAAQSIVYLAPFSRFDDGLEALVRADRAGTGGGANEPLIRALYQARI